MTSPIDASDDDARLIEIATETARLAAEAASIIARRSSRPAAPSAPADRWITTKAAMRIAGVDSPSTIYRWADYSLINHQRAGGRRMFSENDIAAIAELRAKGRLRRVNGEETDFTAN